MSNSRVVVRYPNSADEDEFLAVRRGSLQHFRPWLTATPLTADDLYGPDAFADYLASSDGIRLLQFVICIRETGRIAGGIRLKNIFRGNEQNATLSYWIGAEFAGQHYASDGIIELSTFAFSVLGLHRLEANIAIDNYASIGAVKRAGFEMEGICRQFAKLRGFWIDHARFALVA